MLGWEFFVTRRGDEDKALSLASWTSGLDGTDWLDRLVTEGVAIGLGGNGYPNRYLVPAEHLLLMFEKGLPAYGGPLVIGDDYIMPPGWRGQLTVDHRRLRELDPSEQLMVEAWDQS